MVLLPETPWESQSWVSWMSPSPALRRGGNCLGSSSSPCSAITPGFFSFPHPVLGLASKGHSLFLFLDKEGSSAS
jgi:hypothetical protein